MDQMQTHGKDSSQDRCTRAMKSLAFDGLRRKKLIETNAEDFLAILNQGKVSVAHYLRRLHNLALSLGWLAVPVLAPRLWPKPQFKAKRGITLAIAEAGDNARAAEFYRRYKLLGIAGVSLHSYRCAWAERAKDLRVSRTLRPGSAGAQQQGGASRLSSESPRINPNSAGLRAKAHRR